MHANQCAEGSTFNMLDSIFCKIETYKVLQKIPKEGGTLLIVQGGTFNLIRGLWCPTFGGGGWVDELKDPDTHNLLKQLRNEFERQAVNCMAL